MARALDILNNLQLKLTATYDKAEMKTSDVEEMFGPGFVNQYTADAEEEDVPNVGDSRPYVTNRAIPVPKGKKAGSNYLPFESAIYEQDDDDDPNTPKGNVDLKHAPDAMNDSDIGNDPGTELNVDPTAGDMGGMGDVGGMGDAGGMGGGFGMEQEEPKTAGELGRIYELKKIYSRLTSLESYLADEASKEMTGIRNNVSQGIELFEIVSSNFDSYKDKLDEIIVMYYKFILEVYGAVKDYYKREASAQKSQINEDTLTGVLIVKGAIVLTVVTSRAVAAYQRKYSEAGKACSKFEKTEKTLCMLEYKIKAHREKIKEYKRIMIQCKKTRTPLSCEEELKIRIRREERKINRHLRARTY